MTTYAIKITQKKIGCDDEFLLFSKPLTSEEHKKKLEKRLIFDDTKLARYTNYFSETKKALKIQNIILRVFYTIVAFFSDLITWPSNYRTRFLENIPVYKYLQSKDVSNIFLDKTSVKRIYFITQKVKRTREGQLQVERIENVYSKDATLANHSGTVMVVIQHFF